MQLTRMPSPAWATAIARVSAITAPLEVAYAAPPSRGRSAAIGDSLRTDIAGARAAGIDGIFITGGLQGAALGADPEGNVAPARLAAFCETAGEAPAAALPVLRW